MTKSTEHGNYGYGYNDVSRLLTADNPTLPDDALTYDGVGNRTAVSGVDGDIVHNSNNELRQYGQLEYDYDASGNLTEVRQGSDILWTYVYDAANRMVHAEDSSGSIVADYYYDPFGRRLWKDVGGTRTYFFYADEGLIGEYDASGNEIRAYGYKPDSTWTTAPLWLKQQGAYYWYQNDHLGTPQKLTAVNGVVVWSAQYAAFGQADVQVETVVNNLRFPGQYEDAETGLHYNYHRYYNSISGRYITVDPIGFDGGLNLFAYVQNNPVNLFDLYGLAACYVLFPDYPVTYAPGKKSTWLGGHAGVIGYDKNGTTRYYEYGRYSPNRSGVFGVKLPSKKGNVRRVTIPDLEMCPDGKPTKQSLEKLKKALSRRVGKGTRVELTCYPDADEKKVYEYVNKIAHDPNRRPYSWYPWSANHCRTFAKDALETGR